MHDIRAIRANPDAFDAAMARRGLSPQAAALLALDEARRAAITAAESAQARRNALSREIGAAMKRGDAEEAARLKAEVAALASANADAEDAALDAALAALPNILDANVPEGADEAANIVLHQHGEPRDIPGAREHWELGEALRRGETVALPGLGKIKVKAPKEGAKAPGVLMRLLPMSEGGAKKDDAAPLAPSED